MNTHRVLTGFLLALGFVLVLVHSVWARRIVILYAAASPIVKALGVPEDEVVGVTRTDQVFPRATKVGSHLRPNLELIRALSPDLVIVGSKKAFPDSAAERLKAAIFRYDPRTLEEILEAIEALGRVLGREEAARNLVAELKAELAALKPLPRRPNVIYEVSSLPLKVAGRRSIVNDIIRVAGGRNLVTAEKKHVLLSPEVVLALNPDFYLYQVGPMNRNPVPPKKRPYFKGLESRVIRVDEHEFARPGLNAFSAAVKLNRIFFETLNQRP